MKAVATIAELDKPIKLNKRVKKDLLSSGSATDD
jgi:hypothetical protein